MSTASSKIHYGWIVVLTGMLVTIGAHGFGRMSYTIILPAMKDGLHLNYTQLGLIGTGNLIGYLAMALIGGILAARLGSRRVISLSLALMGSTMILTGLAQDFQSAFFLRMATGLGHGGAYVPAMALGSAWFAMNRRGFATGIVSAGIGGGTMIASFIVPLALSAYGQEGWRYAWYYLGSAVLLIAAIAAVFIRSRPEELGLLPVGSEATAQSQGPGRPGGPQPGLEPGLQGKRNVVSRPGVLLLRFLVYYLYDLLCRLFSQRDGLETRGRQRPVGPGGRSEHLLRSALGRDLRSPGTGQGRRSGLFSPVRQLFDFCLG